MGAVDTLLRTLRSQKLGVVLGFASAALFGVGSVLMDAAPEDYVDLHFDDMRLFLEQPRLAYWWFYLLGAAIGTWGLSAAVCTWHSISVRIQQRVLRPSAYGAPLLHITFILALVVHLWSGLAAETRQHVVGPNEATEIAGARYRTLGLEADLYPTGMPRGVTVTLAREADGATETVAVGYNVPYVQDGGVTALLLGRYSSILTAGLTVGGEQVFLTQGQQARVGDTLVVLRQVHQGASLRVPVVDVALIPAGGGPARRERVGYSPRLNPRQAVSFNAIERRPVVQLTERYNPSTPLVIAVSVLAILGVILVALEHLWRERRRRLAAPPSPPSAQAPPPPPEAVSAAT